MSKTTHKINTDELREATKEFDREQLGVPGKPMTKAQREMHRSAKKKAQRGRPTKGEGSTVIGISIERGSLKKADAMAKRRNVGRSQLFVEAMEQALAQERYVASRSAELAARREARSAGHLKNMGGRGGCITTRPKRAAAQGSLTGMPPIVRRAQT